MNPPSTTIHIRDRLSLSSSGARTVRHPRLRNGFSRSWGVRIADDIGSALHRASGKVFDEPKALNSFGDSGGLGSEPQVFVFASPFGSLKNTSQCLQRRFVSQKTSVAINNSSQKRSSLEDPKGKAGTSLAAWINRVILMNMDIA